MAPVVAISPRPSAMNVPTFEKLLVPNVVSSVVPVIAKTYVPFRLALLKPPVGGGAGVLEPPLHEEVQATATTVRTSRRRFIAHLSLRARQAFAALGPCCCER